MLLSPSSLSKTDLEFFQYEILRWLRSKKRFDQIKGFLYYENKHDILMRKRTVIGGDGSLQTVSNLPNNRVVDNQYAKMVDQKADYLLGRPFMISTENDSYLSALKSVFNGKFRRTLKCAGRAALNGGIAWLYPYYNEYGALDFRLFPSYEILPFWNDSLHTRLDCVVRLFQTEKLQSGACSLVNNIEIFDESGIRRFVLENSSLVPVAPNPEPYILSSQGSKGYNWNKIPFIPVKYGESEIPLLSRVKSLQDGINAMLSDFQNNMQEDSRNTILVLKNYDGENLAEFRKNLAAYGAVKVRCDSESSGGVDTLKIEVNSQNYSTILELFKTALIENAMGYDAKDDRLSGAPNQMNILSMYSDIDLDANDMENELQAAFEDLLWFVNVYLANSGKGCFFDQNAEFIFNRDLMINESQSIADCRDSIGIISDKTIIEHHPWINNAEKETKRLRIQREQELKTKGNDNDD